MTQLATQEPETSFVEADLVYTVDTGVKPVTGSGSPTRCR